MVIEFVIGAATVGAAAVVGGMSVGIGIRTVDEVSLAVPVCKQTTSQPYKLHTPFLKPSHTRR